MPYKFIEDRRNKFSKATYRVTNWPEHDAASGDGSSEPINDDAARSTYCRD